MLGPSETTTSSSGATTLAHAQGVLCDFNGSAGEVAKCANAGTTSTVAAVPVRMPENGTIEFSAITRFLSFEEYSLFRLTCDGDEKPVRAVSGKAIAQPDWFKTVPGVSSQMGAVDGQYTTTGPLAANSSCELTFSFDLDSSLPYTPYDLTIKIKAP
jgi:hypothetical protein